MTDDLNAVPSGETRKTIAERVRHTANRLADTRIPAVEQKNNGEAKAALAGADAEKVAAHGTFTKGLTHDSFGRVSRGDLRKLVSEINQDSGQSSPAESPFPGTYGSGKPAPFDVPLHNTGHSDEWSPGIGSRGWESPLGGHVYDLEGPDADQVAMPPAPALGSDELVAEMGEVYGAALLRDIPFTAWEGDAAVADVTAKLAALPFFQKTGSGNTGPEGRRYARTFTDALTPAKLFRGSTPGAQTGPYISQFMLVGSPERVSADPSRAKAAPAAEPASDAYLRSSAFVAQSTKESLGLDPKEPVQADAGFISYGLQAVDQRVRPHERERDHMTEWTSWTDVQNGANRKDLDFYLTANQTDVDADASVQLGDPISRFIATPRDLATYVHFDALYQAYLNACLLLLAEKYENDFGLPEPAGTRDAFASYGGPHILTLVTEVATRALKAVRRQKYNVHLRSRPEAVAAGIALAWAGKSSELGSQGADLGKMAQDLAPVLALVKDHNAAKNAQWAADGWAVDLGETGEDFNALLPMAFPEGSPMHPAYGAGHATVAGACVTILKAYFEMYEIGAEKRGFKIWDIVNKFGGYPGAYPADLFGDEKVLKVTYRDPDGAEPAKHPACFVPDLAARHNRLKKAE